MRRDGELFFTVWGDGEDGMVPVPRFVRISPGTGEASVPTVDWGDVVEVCAGSIFVRGERRDKPRVLSSADFFLGDRRAKVELISEGGLNLAFTPAGGRTETYSIGEGKGGELSVFDVGSARFLSVKAATEAGERLVLLTRNAETALDVEGDAAGITDGRPTVTERLDTVRGYERRTGYEFKNGGFHELGKEIGFFTREETEPSSDGERALSIAEELRLGTGRWRELLSEELASAQDELKGFLGEYDEARLHPLEEGEGRATVGLIKRDGNYAYARKFLFSFDNGKLTDIREF